VKMGDRFLQVGCAHGGRMAAVAVKVGLSGRAAVVAPDEASAARARKAAEEAGVLVEVETAPPTRLPLTDDAFGSSLTMENFTPGSPLRWSTTLAGLSTQLVVLWTVML